jgi:hypothetical protein
MSDLPDVIIHYGRPLIFFNLRDPPGFEIFGRVQKNAPLYFCTPETIFDLLIKENRHGDMPAACPSKEKNEANLCD